MRRFAITTAMATLMLCAGAWAGCPYPERMAELPDGKTASKEDMLAAQKSVKAYVEEMEAYLRCLEDEIAALGEEATEEHVLIRDKRHNAAVDAMDTVAANFNFAVREYKAANN